MSDKPIHHQRFMKQPVPTTRDLDPVSSFAAQFMTSGLHPLSPWPFVERVKRQHTSNTTPGPGAITQGLNFDNTPLPQALPPWLLSNSAILTTEATGHASPLLQLYPHHTPVQLPQIPQIGATLYPEGYLFPGVPSPSRELDLQTYNTPVLQQSPTSDAPLYPNHLAGWDSGLYFWPAQLSQQVLTQQLGIGFCQDIAFAGPVPPSDHSTIPEVNYPFGPLQHASPPPVTETMSPPAETICTPDQTTDDRSASTCLNPCNAYIHCLFRMKCPGKAKTGSSGIFRCPPCGGWFKCETGVQRHIENLNPRRVGVCPVNNCCKAYARLDKLQDHIHTKHKDCDDYERYTGQEFLKSCFKLSSTFTFPNSCDCKCVSFGSYHQWLKYVSQPDNYAKFVNQVRRRTRP
ncbi:hypothetical protein FQN57_005379 [Myotisia sp. PD_48]|nr:hypothetical protein FQN57_005379 [Myotisia sp. PD_48]